MLNKPWITSPIVGATKLAHVDDAVGTLDIELSDDEIAFLEEPYKPHALSGFGPLGFQDRD